MNAERFPLTRLPNACSQNVLRIMNPVELVGFSLNSTRCKELVKSLKLEAEPILITISSYLELEVELPKKQFMLLHFYKNNPNYLWETGNHGLKKQLKSPQSVSLKFPSNALTESQWRIDRLGLREWLEHLQFIFNSLIVIGVRFAEESFNFDVDSVKSTLPNIIQLGCFNTGSHEFMELILKTFMPIKSITIEPIGFRDSKVPSNLLVQKFYGIFIDERPDRTNARHLKLDDFLLINCKSFVILGLVIDVKELNKFLKLWIKGAAPNIEFLFVDYANGRETDRDVLMKGINYQRMPNDLRRPFRSNVCRGGMDFYRYDGVKATIHHGRRGNDFRFAMYVWFDHCSTIEARHAECRSLL